MWHLLDSFTGFVWLAHRFRLARSPASLVTGAALTIANLASRSLASLVTVLAVRM